MNFKIPIKILFTIENNTSLAAQAFFINEPQVELERNNFLMRYLRNDYPSWSEPKQDYINFINNTPHWAVTDIEIVNAEEQNKCS